MTDPPQKADFRKVFLILGLGIIALYSLLIVLGLLYFRSEIRNQILQRDGIHLTSVANFLNARSQEETLPELKLLHLAIETSAIEGIIAVRVFDADGNYLEGVPVNLYPGSLATADSALLTEGKPVVNSYAEYPPYALFNDFDSEVAHPIPLVEVISPIIIPNKPPIGFIQFWSDGTTVIDEFHQLDQKLFLSGIILISGGGLIVLVLFTFARRRLVAMASLLAIRNRSLEKANADLAMAARTSAIGSVASHLFHGLKNPLAGLKTYLKVTGQDEEAMAITERMQSLIDESLSVLRDQASSLNGSLSLDELRRTITARLTSLTTAGGPHLNIECSGPGTLSGQKVQLLLLVIRNLVENAIDASPSGSTIHIRVTEQNGSLTAEVEDSGPGLPESVRSRLFEPVHSTKSGGTGIGLAISAAIARHIPANLELKSSSPNGTVFAITISNRESFV